LSGPETEPQCTSVEDAPPPDHVHWGGAPCRAKEGGGVVFAGRGDRNLGTRLPVTGRLWPTQHPDARQLPDRRQFVRRRTADPASPVERVHGVRRVRARSRAGRTSCRSPGTAAPG